MADAIIKIGDFLASEFSKEAWYNTKCKFRRDLSKMHLESLPGGVRYGEMTPQDSKPFVGSEIDFNNDSDGTDTHHYKVDETFTQSFTWSLTEGVSIATKFEAKLPIVAKGDVTVTLNFSATQTHTDTKTQSFSGIEDIQIPPRSRIKGNVLITVQKYNIPFYCFVQVRGTVATEVLSTGEIRYDDIAELIENKWWKLNFVTEAHGVCKGVHGRKYKIDVHQYPCDKDAKGVQK